MFGMSISEIVLILVVALVVLGPKKLPVAARKLGALMGQLQRMSRDLSETIRQESMDVQNSAHLNDEATVVKAEPVDHSNQDSAVPNMDDFEQQKDQKTNSDKENIKQVYNKGNIPASETDDQLWNELYGDPEKTDSRTDSDDSHDKDKA